MKCYFFAAFAVALVCGHGTINSPMPRLQSSQQTAGWCVGKDVAHVEMQDGTCLWYNQGCQIGCAHCTGTDCAGGQLCCLLPQEPTLNETYRTYPKLGYHLDFTRHNPWRAPGYAPVIDPCGIAGGYFDYGPGPEADSHRVPRGIERGRRGLNLSEVSSVHTVWKPGSVVEVSWSMYENHGGGYQYRLCKKRSGSQYLTEECFQRNPLDFVNDTQWLQWGTDTSTRTPIPATKVSEGVKPVGSTWMRNPIPACAGASGGGKHGACDEPQFDPPITERIDGKKFPAGQVGTWNRKVPGLYGYGLGACDSRHPETTCTAAEYRFYAEMFNFNIIDKVKVPDNLPSGEYLLSFRWDTEQRPAVWSGCSDILVY